MKRRFRGAWPLLLAVLCIITFALLLVWQRDASDNATAALDDRAGSRDALAPFPLLFQLSDYAQTQHIAIEDAAISSTFYYGSPRQAAHPAAITEQAEVLAAYVPQADNAITPVPSADAPNQNDFILTTDRLDLYLQTQHDDGSLLRIPSGLSYRRETPTLQLRYTGEGWFAPAAEGNDQPLGTSCMRVTADDGTVFLAPDVSTEAMPDTLTGTVSLLRADSFVPYRDALMLYPETPTAPFPVCGDATALVSYPVGERIFCSLTAVGNDVLLLSHDQTQLYFTLYDRQGRTLDEYRITPDVSPIDAVGCKLFPDGDTLNFQLSILQETSDEAYIPQDILLSLDTRGRALTPLFCQPWDEPDSIKLLCFREGVHLTVSTESRTIPLLQNLRLPSGAQFVTPLLQTCRLTVRAPDGALLYAGTLITDCDDDQPVASTERTCIRRLAGIYLLDQQTEHEEEWP